MYVFDVKCKYRNKKVKYRVKSMSTSFYVDNARDLVSMLQRLFISLRNDENIINDEKIPWSGIELTLNQIHQLLSSESIKLRASSTSPESISIKSTSNKIPSSGSRVRELKMESIDEYKSFKRDA